MRGLIGQMRRTIEIKEMIKENDRICVGISAGKDSMVLLTALNIYKRFSKIPFELEAMTIDLGFEDFDLTPVKTYIEGLGIPYTIVKTDIKEVVFDIRKEKNPCSLCANMRRGVLTSSMNERNLNRLALGHHADDALETLFMNMLYSGKMNTMEYVSYLSRTDINMIRPLLDTSEAQILQFIKKYNVPFLKSPCPADQNTKREDIGNMLEDLYKTIPNSRKNILSAMRNEKSFNLF